MKPDKLPCTADAAELRQRAEALLPARSAGRTAPETPENLQRLLHELQVHQIELEIQNEELQLAQSHVETALERFADFYDFAPVGFITLSRDGTISRANLAGARLLEAERSRLVGKRFATYVADGQRQTFSAFLQKAWSSDARQTCELTLSVDGQSPRMVEISATLSPDQQECRAVVVDITERKRSAEQLQEMNWFNEQIIECAQEGIVVYGRDLRYLRWNSYMEKFTGMRAADVLGRHPLDVFPFLKESSVIENLEHSLAGGMPRSVEFRFTIEQTGQTGWALDRNSPLRNARGEVIGVIGTVSDITERKQAELALAASEARFRDIVNSTDGIVWEADAQTFDFTFISDQAERLLGYPTDDWLQPGFWKMHLHPQDRDWAAEYCSSCTQRLMPHNFEYRFIASDGRTVWLHDIVTVVVENGAPRWLRGIMMDITRRRQTEDKLTALTESLEARVIERTRELRRVSLELSMLEERERRALAEDLHDNLGQLLAVIKIKLTSLSDDREQTSVDGIVELVDRADRAARNITQQLSPPVLQTLGLAPALEWLADEMGRLYGLKVHTDLGECSRHLADGIQAVLYRSTRELLINVAKHAGVKDASLTCLCSREMLLLVVSDAGNGFAADEYFDQSSGDYSFGLRSIRERLSNLGGSMDIDSSPGSGTTVSLSVPRIIDGKEICNDPNNACR